MPTYHSASGSVAEDLFIVLFSEAFGAEKAGYLYSQYHFYDIYQNSRYADFVLENGARRVAIEIDDETSHNKSLVASNKFYDDLLKQNSMVHLGWDVYRWAVRQMQIQPEAVKDELRVFLGSHPQFKEIEAYIKPELGHKQISLITSHDIQRMYNRLKKNGRIKEDADGSHALSDATVNHIHTMLHGAMKDAVQANIIPRNPTEGPTAPKPNYKPKKILNEQ